MYSSSRESVVAAFDALDTAVEDVVALDLEVLSTPERLALLARLQRVRRLLPLPEQDMLNQLRAQASPAEVGGSLAHGLANRLLISRGEAHRRINEAHDLGARRALTGQALPPRLPATAAAQRHGNIGAGQIQVIRRFLAALPCWVDVETRERAEAHLARLASGHRPDQLRKLADRLADCLNPDGEFSDEDRARRRGLRLGPQDAAGMSALRAWLSPAARAALEAVLAKLAAPGMANPYDEQPVLDDAPCADAVQRDTRTPAQRNHDALHAALRAMLASGQLGQHNGLPAAIVVTTSLRELESGAGQALTGGGTLLPMSEVIRLARHARHYLAIFDKGQAIALYHTKRLASAGQRIVLYAKDRGCSHPGCDVPGYLSEVHHVEEWANVKETHVDNLTFACGPHHRLIKPGGWKTRKRANGDTEWIPPPHLDHNQPRTNTFHHPERLLTADTHEP